MPSPTPQSLVLLVALAATLYLVGNGRVSLWDRDEPRYAQTSRQMLEDGDWVVPRFLDTVRTAKPVFIYWCQATSMAVLGTEGDAGVFAARLPSALAMTLVLALGAAVLWRAVSPAHAFWTVMVLSTAALTVWSAKACTTDAVLLVGITIAQLCLYQVWRGRATWPVVILMAVAIGQAGLTKGPVVLGVLATTLLALGVLRLIDRKRLSFDVLRSMFSVRRSSSDANIEHRTSNIERRSEKDSHPNPLLDRARGQAGPGMPAAGTIARVVVAIAIVAAIVGPWLYLVRQREATFLGTSVSHDVFTRVIRPLEGHSGPPGYHLALIFATFLPWSPLLPMAVVFGWKHRTDPRLRFALAAVLGPWVMFELVQTKLPHYMLPAFPPLAFLTADAIVRCLRGEADDLQRRAFVVGVAVAMAALVALGVGTVALAARFGDPIVPPAVLALATVGFAAVVMRAFVRRNVTLGLLATGVGMVAVYAVLFGLYLPNANVLRVSARTAALLHREGATGGAAGEALMLDYKEPSLAFYQGGTIWEHSAMVLSHELLDRAPAWLVITDDVWDRSPDDVRARAETLGSVRGLAYADGRAVTVFVVRKR